MSNPVVVRFRACIDQRYTPALLFIFSQLLHQNRGRDLGCPEILKRIFLSLDNSVSNRARVVIWSLSRLIDVRAISLKFIHLQFHIRQIQASAFSPCSFKSSLLQGNLYCDLGTLQVSFSDVDSVGWIIPRGIIRRPGSVAEYAETGRSTAQFYSRWATDHLPDCASSPSEVPSS
jgi:hypothetical protein